MALLNEVGSSNMNSLNSNGSVKRMGMLKESTFDQLLFAESLASPKSESKSGGGRQRFTGLANTKNLHVHSGLDLHEDFVSDADSDK